MIMTRDEMLEKLREGVCKVTFTKINGEERIMDCTLAMDFIPEDRRPKTGKEYSDTIVRAFDVNKGEFRTFRPDFVSAFVV